LDQIIEREGIFVLQEEESLDDYAHNKTAEWLGIAPTNKHRVPLLSFAVVGIREARLWCVRHTCILLLKCNTVIQEVWVVGIREARLWCVSLVGGVLV
jgi:hypothetical protein